MPQSDQGSALAAAGRYDAAACTVFDETAGFVLQQHFDDREYQVAMRPRLLLSVTNTAGGARSATAMTWPARSRRRTDVHGATNYHYYPAHQLSYLIYQQGGDRP
jgi:hypothetical protein